MHGRLRKFERRHRSATNCPSASCKLTRGDLVNYAGVSGDANPIHWSDEVVKLAGLDNVVAHGMLTMGLGGGFVTSWLGDPGAVKEYNVRFTSPVYVGCRQGRRGRVHRQGEVGRRREQDRSRRDRGAIRGAARSSVAPPQRSVWPDAGRIGFQFARGVKYTEISGVTQRCALPCGAVDRRGWRACYVIRREVGQHWIRGVVRTRSDQRGVAQLAEQRSPKPQVAGSSPVAPAPGCQRLRGTT